VSDLAVRPEGAARPRLYLNVKGGRGGLWHMIGLDIAKSVFQIHGVDADDQDKSGGKK